MENMDMKKVIEQRLTLAEQERTFTFAKVEALDKEIELYTTLLNLYEETEKTMSAKNPVPVIEHKFPKGDYKERTTEYVEEKKEEPVTVVINGQPLTTPIAELEDKIKNYRHIPETTQKTSGYSLPVIRILERATGHLSATEIALAMGINVGSVHKALIMMVGQKLIKRDENKRYYVEKKEVV